MDRIFQKTGDKFDIDFRTKFNKVKIEFDRQMSSQIPPFSGGLARISANLTL